MILSRTVTAIKDVTDSKKYLRGDSYTRFTFPVLLAKFPKCVESYTIRLRPLRILDSRPLKDGLRNRDILNATGLIRPISGSSLSLWWWLKRTYGLLYGIEVDSRCIGFIGLYNVTPPESAEMSLVIFNSGVRRRGYGTMAFTLFAQTLGRHRIIEKILVEVKTDNHAALSFWKELGFEENDSCQGIQTMSLQVAWRHLP